MDSQRDSNLETIVLGGGCFWCTEAVFLAVEGVVSVESGYAGGHMPDPDYESVCGGGTGHAEAVRIVFDPSVITCTDILEIFFATHDPTTLNRQGADIGTQYRSVIFHADARQRGLAQSVIDALTRDRVFDAPIVTELAAMPVWYPAEAYHQRFYERNPYQGYCMAVVGPKVAKFRRRFASRLKNG